MGERFECRELEEDMAVPIVSSAGVLKAYVRPRRNGGGSYVTPNSVCVQ